jgi:alkylmercury lyase
MVGRTVDLRDIATRVLRLDQPLTKVEQRLLREGQRALVHGQPLAIEELGRLADVSPLEIPNILGRLPGFARFDDLGRLVGLLGLSLECSAYRFDAAGSIVSTWCAWDSLFIPRVIGVKARVASHCPITQKLIQLVVGPEGVIWTSSTDVRISFFFGRETDESLGVVGACCRHIHFLGSVLAADLWLSDHPEGFVLTLDEAWEVGRLFVDEVLFAVSG